MRLIANASCSLLLLFAASTAFADQYLHTFGNNECSTYDVGGASFIYGSSQLEFGDNTGFLYDAYFLLFPGVARNTTIDTAYVRGRWATTSDGAGYTVSSAVSDATPVAMDDGTPIYTGWLASAGATAPNHSSDGNVTFIVTAQVQAAINNASYDLGDAVVIRIVASGSPSGILNPLRRPNDATTAYRPLFEMNWGAAGITAASVNRNGANLEVTVSYATAGDHVLLTLYNDFSVYSQEIENLPLSAASAVHVFSAADFNWAGAGDTLHVAVTAHDAGHANVGASYLTRVVTGDPPGQPAGTISNVTINGDTDALYYDFSGTSGETISVDVNGVNEAYQVPETGVVSMSSLYDFTPGLDVAIDLEIFDAMGASLASWFGNVTPSGNAPPGSSASITSVYLIEGTAGLGVVGFSCDGFGLTDFDITVDGVTYTFATDQFAFWNGKLWPKNILAQVGPTLVTFVWPLAIPLGPALPVTITAIGPAGPVAPGFGPTAIAVTPAVVPLPGMVVIWTDPLIKDEATINLTGYAFDNPAAAPPSETLDSIEVRVSHEGGPWSTIATTVPPTQPLPSTPVPWQITHPIAALAINDGLYTFEARANYSNGHTSAWGSRQTINRPSPGEFRLQPGCRWFSAGQSQELVIEWHQHDWADPPDFIRLRYGHTGAGWTYVEWPGNGTKVGVHIVAGMANDENYDMQAQGVWLVNGVRQFGLWSFPIRAWCGTIGSVAPTLSVHFVGWDSFQVEILQNASERGKGDMLRAEIYEGTPFPGALIQTAFGARDDEVMWINGLFGRRIPGSTFNVKVCKAYEGGDGPWSNWQSFMLEPAPTFNPLSTDVPTLIASFANMQRATNEQQVAQSAAMNDFFIVTLDRIRNDQAMRGAFHELQIIRAELTGGAQDSDGDGIIDWEDSSPHDSSMTATNAETYQASVTADIATAESKVSGWQAAVTSEFVAPTTAAALTWDLSIPVPLNGYIYFTLATLPSEWRYNGGQIPYASALDSWVAVVRALVGVSATATFITGVCLTIRQY